ncbi:hypothetical protein D3C85_1911490 [compost metagenome]
MLPFDALRPITVSPHLVPARGQVYSATRAPHPLPVAATVEIAVIVTVVVDLLA